MRTRCVLLGALVVIIGGTQNISLAAIPAAGHSKPELSYSCLVKYVSIGDFAPYKTLSLGIAWDTGIEIGGHSYRNIMWNFDARPKRADCQPCHMFVCQFFKPGTPIADYTQSPNPKFVSGRLPGVFESNGSHWVFRMCHCCSGGLTSSFIAIHMWSDMWVCPRTLQSLIRPSASLFTAIVSAAGIASLARKCKHLPDTQLILITDVIQRD